MIASIIYVAFLVFLVCFVLMLITMYSRKKTILLIVCIVLTVIYGVGPLIAFVYGWINVKKWNLYPLMYVWSGAFLVILILIRDVTGMLPSWLLLWR